MSITLESPQSNARATGDQTPVAVCCSSPARSIQKVLAAGRRRLSVQWFGASCCVELACGKDVLCSGPWAIDVRIDGVPAVPTSEWDELCWVSDDDVDYLELGIELGEGLRLERHLVLARDDHFLLLADAVRGSRWAAIEYRGTLSVGPDVKFRQSCDTRQGTLIGSKPRAAILPLALPKKLADPCSGGLVAGDAGLELRQTAEGQSLFAPLFFDLNPRRFRAATASRAAKKSLLWRQLTVSQSWAAQPDDVAVGYRVAVGKEQWLIYRSLARPASRSLLGHNLQTETLVARFDRKGEVEPLIEIE